VTTRAGTVSHRQTGTRTHRPSSFTVVTYDVDDDDDEGRAFAGDHGPPPSLQPRFFQMPEEGTKQADRTHILAIRYVDLEADDGDGSPSGRAPVRLCPVRFGSRPCLSPTGRAPRGSGAYRHWGRGPDQARYDEQPQQGRDESEPRRSSVPS
jgi:hypothetical protein